MASVSPPRALLERVVAVYVRAYGVSMMDVEVPPGGFKTFDEFFTRRLQPGARPLEGASGVGVSPCDGRVLDRGPVDLGGSLRIKGRLYGVAELAGEEAAPSFDGGEFIVIYLSPRDYHRVHSPADARIQRLEHYPGTLLPVNGVGVRLVPSLFARNERMAFHLQTDAFGPVCLVMVGATGVGRITVPFDDLVTNRGPGPRRVRRYEPALPVARGDELGTFHLGSTVVLFFSPGRTTPTGPGPGEAVRMGRALVLPAETT